MNLIYFLAKKLLWPGPDYGTRVRYNLKKNFLKGSEITTLDVGCGNGCMTVAAAELGKYALGISNQKEYIDRAKKFCAHIGMPNEKCEFRLIDIYDLEKQNLPQFDQIILFEVLEHLYYDEKALKVCAGLLKTDGWMHITVPNRDSHQHAEPLSRIENGMHVRHGYDFSTLETLLKKVGLEPIDRQEVGKLGTVLGFKGVAIAGKLPGILGRIASVLAFFFMWPFVQVFNLFPARPWSLYVIAAKRKS